MRRPTFERPYRCGWSFLVGGVLASAAGCGLLPTREDLGSATNYVKDQVTGKARRDRLTKNFSEARILERRKDFVGAAKLYREVLAEEPRSRDCHHRLGVMSAVQGKFDEAHALYRTALECGDPTADLWSDIGYCHYMQHQMPEAEGALRQALALQPQHRTALNNLAMVVGEQGNLEEAYRLFRQGNSEAEAECNFAYLCAECGDLPQAQQHFSRALSLDPTIKPAAEALLQVTARLDQWQQACEQQASLAAANGPAPQDGGIDPATGLPADGVQQAAYSAPVERPTSRPRIEVFTGGPRSAAASAAVAQAAQTARNAAPQTAPSGVVPAGYHGPQAPGPTQPTLLHPTVGGQAPAAKAPASNLPNQSPTLTAPVVNNAPVRNAPVNTVQPGVVNPAAVQPAAVQPATLPPSSGLAPFSVPTTPQPQYLQPSGTPPMQRAGAGTSPQAAAEPTVGASGPFPSLLR